MTRVTHEGRTVYFIRPVGGGPVKIGCSNQPMGRFKFFDSWSPIPMEMVAKAPGRMVDEYKIHAAFSKFRMHGEWFESNPALDDLMGLIVATGAIPTEFLAPPSPPPEPERTPQQWRAYWKKFGEERQSRPRRKLYEYKLPREEVGRRISEGRLAANAAKRGDKVARMDKYQLVAKL